MTWEGWVGRWVHGRGELGGWGDGVGGYARLGVFGRVRVNGRVWGIH